MPYVRRRRAAPRRKIYRRKARITRRKGTRTAYRAIRIARSVSRKVAAEVCKFETTPDMYVGSIVSYDTATSSYQLSANPSLLQITSGEPWVMPLNWFYIGGAAGAGEMQSVYVNSIQYTGGQLPPNPYVSVRYPVWYNALLNNPTNETNQTLTSNFQQLSTGFQYRLKYMYLNGLFNTDGNSDGALRIVILKDRQPTGGSAVWYDEYTTDNSRGVFNAKRIDAQLNPQTVGRYKIMYDKTLRFTTINSYKPWKYYKRLSTIVRNNWGYRDGNDEQDVSSTQTISLPASRWVMADTAPPVQKNAYYMLMFADGVNFTYTSESSTGEGAFHMFTRIAYYNN